MHAAHAFCTPAKKLLGVDLHKLVLLVYLHKMEQCSEHAFCWTPAKELLLGVDLHKKFF